MILIMFAFFNKRKLISSLNDIHREHFKKRIQINNLKMKMHESLSSFFKSDDS